MAEKPELEEGPEEETSPVEREEKTLNCSLSPEHPSWAFRCGVFFDVVNKTDRNILITGLCAGSYGGDREATLYACTKGASSGNETNEAVWKVLWSGMLKLRASTPVNLNLLLKLGPGATQGLLLVSKDYAVYHTIDPRPVEDDNIMICAGVRSTEHRGNLSPFDPNAQSPRERSTHAGSISYMFGKSYIVTCQAAEPDADGLTQITCTNLAGAELASISIGGAEAVATLRQHVAEALSSQLCDAGVQIELLSGGELLSDATSIAEAFEDK